MEKWKEAPLDDNEGELQKIRERASRTREIGPELQSKVDDYFELKEIVDGLNKKSIDFRLDIDKTKHSMSDEELQKEMEKLHDMYRYIIEKEKELKQILTEINILKGIIK
jgi:hypothetical protein